ncbi:MAG TPA: undecaprenyl-phosphate glucose phosphotransferase [Myxococcaceae bacterium]|jgi:Undecaprenyl-phosphate glucose phosphotransferase|nr:undecaprenyl-phosphate glucose phosphotransferase [Myxococcaceae bacterium]
MFGRLQRFYTSIKVATDLVVLVVAFALAYLTRLYGPFSEPVLPLRDSLITLGLGLVLFPLAYRQAHLYATNRARTNLEEVSEVVKASVTATVILVALTYFLRERYSRATLGLFLAYAVILVSATRLAFRSVLASIRRRGRNLKTILLIGTGSLGERVVETIEAHAELGFRVVGALSRQPLPAGSTVCGVPVIGTVADLEGVLAARPVDQVILALPSVETPLLEQLMERLALQTVDVKVVPDLFQYVTLYGGLEEFGGLPLIGLQGGPLEGWNLVAKRAFDLLLSLLALALVWPLLVALALLVKLTSRGPVLFRQERMGMDGRTFPILKFRTMRTDAEASGAVMARAGDVRRTPLGAFLRASSLDELPQLFNVLRGDMSLVGPRPERPVFIEEFKRRIPKYHLRHKVKAGITGWAQIHGLRGQTSIEKRIEYDLYYIENWSLGLDVKILLRTALGGFLSRHAY